MVNPEKGLGPERLDFGFIAERIRTFESAGLLKIMFDTPPPDGTDPATLVRNPQIDSGPNALTLA